MATLEELLAEQARRQQAPAKPTLDQLLAERARRAAAAPVVEEPRYPTDPELTAERFEELGELTDIGALIPEASAFQKLSQAGLNMITPDPMELADILTTRFPDMLDVRLSPEGAPVVRNKETGKEFAINKPDFSGMDVLQGVGLLGAFTPAGAIAKMGAKAVTKAAITATTRKAIQRKGRRRALGQMAAASGATEAGIQAAQETAGGEFDPEDVALSTATGMVPDIVIDPLVRAGARGKEMIGRTVATVPASIRQALEFAKARGKEITTADALRNELTPAMNIFLKITERIPFAGTGRQRIRQKAQRADTLSEIADEFDINVETEFGEDIAMSFIDRMKAQRFWGKNKNPSTEQVRAAFEREGDEITDNLLQRYIRKGNIDEEVVDRVLDSGRPRRIEQLYAKLDDTGKAATRQRLVAKGLEKAGWTPESPQISDPTAFVKYLDNPKTRKAIKILFSEEDQNLLSGSREYLRMTAGAQETGKGVGMTAAMAGGLGFAYGVLDALIGTAAITGMAGRVAQGRPVRNLLLKLHHAKGNPVLEGQIMQELRPMVVAIGQQAMEGDSAEDDEPFMIPLVGPVRDVGAQMQRLRELTGETTTDVTQQLESMLEE